MDKIGIIGGSGLDDPDILISPRDEVIETPYGTPSSPLKFGQIGDKDVVLLARHGRKHTLTPTQVNNRANIHALKEAGCSVIIATTAVGSLREEIGRGHLIVPDQFLDFTRHRAATFFDSFEVGQIKHTPMSDPFDSKLREIFTQACDELGFPYQEKGTVVTIEGPRFSTRAESHMFRSWGADVINMTTAPECILANEAEIPYAVIAMSTDYDCWKEDEDPVSWEAVLKTFQENASKVTDLLRHVLPKVFPEG
jgi:5'-methylthioadenosine phosphorylase